MKFLDGGLLILSKHPIIEQDSIVFTAGNQIDAWSAKGCIYAKIQVGSSEDRFIHVFNTHLQADYDISNAATRVAQIAQLAAFMSSRLEGLDEPVYLMGDLNINALTPQGEESDEYTRFVQQLEELGFEVLRTSMNGLHWTPLTSLPCGSYVVPPPAR